VLKPGGRALIYQMFTTSLLNPAEAAFLLPVMSCRPSAMRPGDTEAAIANAGLRIDRCVELGSEWGEYYHEHAPARTRHLLRGCCVILIGIARFGKLSSRVYLLSAPGEPPGRLRARRVPVEQSSGVSHGCSGTGQHFC
jgi:hypothetical protein